MAHETPAERRNPTRVTLSPEEKLLVGRHEAAQMLSISRRALDYLVANKQSSRDASVPESSSPSPTFGVSRGPITLNAWLDDFT